MKGFKRVALTALTACVLSLAPARLIFRRDLQSVLREGSLAVMHGVDELEHPSGAALMRCCAGVICSHTSWRSMRACRWSGVRLFQTCRRLRI